MSTVYGAGFGEDTWAQYTEVNLLRGAEVYEVYGGGHNGKVINRKSLLKWAKEDPALDLSMPGYNECGLDHKTLVHATKLGGKYHTNVHINEGATVWNYAYGGGMGDSIKVKQGILGSGDVYGSTYIDLLGGTVAKDLYAAGTSVLLLPVLTTKAHILRASQPAVQPILKAVRCVTSMVADGEVV